MLDFLLFKKPSEDFLRFVEVRFRFDEEAKRVENFQGGFFLPDAVFGADRHRLPEKALAFSFLVSIDAFLINR